MGDRRLNGTVLVIVTLVFLAVMGGCRKSGPAAESEYTGAWAQVPDIVAHIGEPNIPDREFNIMDYKAVADGTTDCRPAIMEAIQACESAGGGRVLIPAGTYLVNGSLYLVSNMNLHLAEGAHIKFGSKYIDYLPLAMTRWKGTRVYNYSPFIYAYRKHNVSLTGRGTLDGQATDTWSTWVEKQAAGAETALRMNKEGNSVIDRFLGDGHFLRPSLVQFMGCDGVLVDGVEIVNSPFWCLHPVFTKRMTIRNVRFDAQNPDNDGIALDSCAVVNIHDVTFSNQGAGVRIISGVGREGRELSRPSRNIYIHDCTFDTEPAVAIADQVAGGVYNVFVEKCQTKDGVTQVLAIGGIQMLDGEVAHVFERRAGEPNAANGAPEVYAGPDAQLDEQGGTMTLNGAVSDDGKPTGKLSHTWSVIQGDAGAVSISDPSALQTQATFAKPGVYILQLEANDGEASGRHFTMVKVGEQPDGMEGVTKPIFPAAK